MSETKNIKKMKAVRLHAIGDLRCDEMEIPVPKGEELLIKVGACGVCGSDYPRTYEHGTSSGIYPLTIGHEFAGEVVAAAGNVSVTSPKMWIPITSPAAFWNAESPGSTPLRITAATIITRKMILCSPSI